MKQEGMNVFLCFAAMVLGVIGFSQTSVYSYERSSTYYEYESAFETGLEALYAEDHPAFKPNQFELGIEAYLYEYDEPSLSVNDEGEFFGGYFAWTHRRNLSPEKRSPRDVFDSEELINMLRAEVRLTRGEVDYTGSGTFDGIVDWNFESRLVFGQDFYMPNQFRITPYAGFGIRYLLDQFDEVPAQNINGQNFGSGYERESRYFYIPIGITFERIAKTWSVAFQFEYDLFLSGTQTSHLEDINDINGNNLGLDELENDQSDGFGLRASVKLIKHMERVSFVFEPFVRYWDIDDSDIKAITSGGGMILDPQSGGFLAGLEPANETLEAGARFGILF